MALDTNFQISLNHWFSTGGPWPTARKSGGPQTFAYFNNGFSSRIRLSNSGAYEPPYGPASINWRRIDFVFFCKSSPIPLTNRPRTKRGPLHMEKVGHGNKLGHEDL